MHARADHLPQQPPAPAHPRSGTLTDAYTLRDSNRHRLEQGRERIRLGVKFYGEDDTRS